MNTVVNYQSEKEYAIITITNGKANAISHEVIEGLNTSLDKALTDKKVVILTGQDGIFSAGYDLKIMTASPASAKDLVIKGSQLSYKMLSFPMPIIVACSGHAIAKGAFLLLSSDYRLGVEGAFKIGLNEVAIGMTMHHAGVTIAKARLSSVYFERSVCNAEIYNSTEAKTAGFLDKIVTNTQLLPEAIKIAEKFANLNRVAYTETKLKSRKLYLEKLAQAIELDAASNISIHS